jgi:CubicO group peptidase (beta-lactamase class C family)
VENLEAQLEPIRAKHGLPALAGAVLHGDEVIARGAVGLRAIGSAEPVTVDDLWHIGSCTKAFTATLIALLVEEGKLSWTTTIGEVLPDLADDVRPEYLGVTVEQLLRHRSGLPTDRKPDPGIRSQLRSFPGSIREQRYQVARLVLQQEPAAPAGSNMLYSNFGYLVAGAMAEGVGAKPWEELLRQRIFDPLGMSSAGFGAPGVADAVTQPRGHRRGNPVEPGPLADNAPVIGPAGTVHLSLADWGKFAALHLAGARGESDFLRQETFQRLYTPSPGGDIAIGWGVQRRGAIGRLLTHAGSNGSWFARIVLAPERNLAILVTMNMSGAEAEKATDGVVIAMIRRFD